MPSHARDQIVISSDDRHDHVALLTRSPGSDAAGHSTEAVAVLPSDRLAAVLVDSPPADRTDSHCCNAFLAEAMDGPQSVPIREQG